MNRRGYFLLELLLSFALLSIIFIITMYFFVYQTRFCSNQIKRMDSSINVRIAIEFLSDKIKNANTVDFKNNILYVDNKKIYLNNDVLTYEYNSLPITNKINSFEVKSLGNGIYELSVISGNCSSTVFVKNR